MYGRTDADTTWVEIFDVVPVAAVGKKPIAEVGARNKPLRSERLGKSAHLVIGEKEGAISSDWTTDTDPDTIFVILWPLQSRGVVVPLVRVKH